MAKIPQTKNSMGNGVNSTNTSPMQEVESVLQLSKPLQHILGGNKSSSEVNPTFQPVSKAVARLLAKTQQEKSTTLEQTEVTSIKLSADESRARVIRERQKELENAEKERIRKSKTKIRVTLMALKHLPKMDLFGKTDAYCVLSIDNSSAGGEVISKKSSTIKKNLDPEWSDERFLFDVFDYPSQILKVECWDWDGSGNDGYIGEVAISLEQLTSARESAEWLELHNRDNNPVFGYDGSKSIIKVKVERDFAEISHENEPIAGKDSNDRTLDCMSNPWESSARGLMFDIDNKSSRPVLITRFHSVAGRGKVGNCAYTIYRTPGKWRVGRCPCNNYSPCRYCICCCGSCPSGRPNFRCMKWCCRCTPAGNDRAGCCCWGECGEGAELAEPCCEGCIPCCTGRFGFNPILVPCCIPLCSFGCGCCTGEELGGAGSPGIPAVPLWRCNGCRCCRDGVHRQAPSCTVCLIPCYCSCCSHCCHCCRKKYFDRRRWTRVTSGWVDLPSDWGSLGPLPPLKDFEGGGILIPPKQRVAVYIHSAYPEGPAGDCALAIRGPFTREYAQGDPVDQDEFIRIRAGPYTDGPVPFANSDLVRSEDDGQFYKMRQQMLHEYASCAFVGKIDYRVLPSRATPYDCVTLCGMCPSLC